VFQDAAASAITLAFRSREMFDFCFNVCDAQPVSELPALMPSVDRWRSARRTIYFLAPSFIALQAPRLLRHRVDMSAALFFTAQPSRSLMRDDAVTPERALLRIARSSEIVALLCCAEAWLRRYSRMNAS